MPKETTGAIFSDCGRYRYLLTRNWANEHHGRVCFIMLNPSTADAKKDDPTIRSCLRLAKPRAGSLRVVNMFAFRATDQKQLLLARDPIGPENDRYIREAVAKSTFVIPAWGREKLNYRSRAAAVRRLLEEIGKPVLCFGETKAGCPKHPLYLPSRTQLKDYSVREK